MARFIVQEWGINVDGSKRGQWAVRDQLYGCIDAVLESKENAEKIAHIKNNKIDVWTDYYNKQVRK